jgi:mycothiol synthase
VTALPAPIDTTTFRHFGGDADFVGMVDMLRAASRYDGVQRHHSVEELTHSYRNLSNCNLDTDLLIAERAGAVVGYSRVTWFVEEATNDRVLLQVGWTHPDVRPLGVAETMLQWCESRLGEIAGQLTHSGRDSLAAYAEIAETDRLAVLADAGYEITQTYEEMTRSLTEPIAEHALPDGVEIRPTTRGDARAIWDADQEAFRDHVGFSPATEGHYIEWLGWKWRDPSLWKVAFAGDTIVGGVLNYVNGDENTEFDRLRGWTEDIHTHREWRGQGIARALITESMKMLRDLGMTEAALGVHVTNPTGAYQLYSGLGYEVTSTEYELRKEPTW